MPDTAAARRAMLSVMIPLPDGTATLMSWAVPSGSARRIARHLGPADEESVFTPEDSQRLTREAAEIDGVITISRSMDRPDDPGMVTGDAR